MECAAPPGITRQRRRFAADWSFDGIESRDRISARHREGRHRCRAHDGLRQAEVLRSGGRRVHARRAEQAQDARHDRHRRRRARQGADALRRRAPRPRLDARARFIRRSTSPSIRSKERTSAPPARPTPSPSSRPRKKAACSTRPTSTWTRSWSAPPPASSSISTHSVQENLDQIAEAFQRDVDELTIIVLDRERHHDLIAQIREAGARIKLITDGDLSAGISAAVRGTGVHAAMGIGGAPEGVLTAAAMRCLNGRMQGRLKPLRSGRKTA